MESATAAGSGVPGLGGQVLAGRFLWTVNNFALFREMIKTQKVMSPCFPAGDCNFRLSVYQSTVNGTPRLILPDSSSNAC